MAQGALPGFRDFYPEQFAERAYITGVWRDVARRFAFVEYDGPPLEPLDLYRKKSGGELVGQIYSFMDRGEREVALRPEMTPTFARMVAARANSLRKPVRWFSIPQLFRQEKQQRGRLREHFQLNADIVGETSVAADAELLAIALDVTRSFGLTHADVAARVSDRRLLDALLLNAGVPQSALATIYPVIDKRGREPADVSREKLEAAAGNADAANRVEAIFGCHDVATLLRQYGDVESAREHIERMRQYLVYVAALGFGEWVRLDLLVWRGKRIQSTPQLVKASRQCPARQLLADIVGINITCQEEASFKHWLIAYDFDQPHKFHAVILPQVVYYCNEFRENCAPNSRLPENREIGLEVLCKLAKGESTPEPA